VTGSGEAHQSGDLLLACAVGSSLSIGTYAAFPDNENSDRPVEARAQKPHRRNLGEKMLKPLDKPRITEPPLRLYSNGYRGLMDLVKTFDDDETTAATEAEFRAVMDGCIRMRNIFFRGPVNAQFVLVRGDRIVGVEDRKAGKFVWCDGSAAEKRDDAGESISAV
jgi:hypothetical protein